MWICCSSMLSEHVPVWLGLYFGIVWMKLTIITCLLSCFKVWFMMQFTLDKIKNTFIRILSGIDFLYGQSIIQDYGSCVHVRTQVALANAEYPWVSELIMFIC